MTHTKSTQLSIPQRLTQELNLNVNGIYLNLVPGDSSLEWALEMGNPVTQSDLRTDKAVFNSIMKDFFIAEVNLAKEQRDNLELIDGRKSTDLRFFKGILTEETNKEIEKQILDPLQDAETIYDSQEAEIKTQTFEYVLSNTNKAIQELVKNGVLEQQYNQKVLSSVVSTPLNFTIDNKKILAYYADFLCVDKLHRNKMYAGIQAYTHYYYGRKKTDNNVVLFKREKTL